MNRIAMLGGVLAMVGACGGEPRGSRSTVAANDDVDGDGLVQADDRCPAASEDRDGFEDNDGCPEFDNDGDGIGDVADQCPGEPGLAPHGCASDVVAVTAVDEPSPPSPPTTPPTTPPSVTTTPTTWYCAVAEHSSICASSEANCVYQATELASWGGMVEACLPAASAWCFESQQGSAWSFRDTDCRSEQAQCEGARMLTHAATRACVQR